MTVRWTNYFVYSTKAFATDGHLPADTLRDAILKHDGREAYHCAYDLEERHDFSNYNGLMRPALGYVWFDFDSHDGGAEALNDVRRFTLYIGNPDGLLFFYSGNKGFHVAVPHVYFDAKEGPDLSESLFAIAHALKKLFPTLDTAVYNANRKFRAVGSYNPKGGLYKVRVTDMSMTIEQIRELAKTRGDFVIPSYIIHSAHIPQLNVPRKEKSQKPPTTEKSWTAPSGVAAFEKCGFLANCKASPQAINEPQWYAALSIVSRFQEGRKQCHGMSVGHPGYSATACNDKIDQAERESGPRTCENVSKLWDGCFQCPQWGKVNSPVNIFDSRFYIVGDKGRLIPDYNALLKSFRDDRAYKTIADMKTVYRFTGTHYEEYTPIEIKAFAEEAFEPKPQEKFRQEFVYKVLANSVTRRTFFTSTTESKINFRNGIIDLSKSNFDTQRAPHDPAIGFRHVLPYDFDPTATAPTFAWWINDVMLGDKELVAILQEYMGYVVRGGEYSYHKALWLSGSGRNGKSTFLSVLKALIGTGNYSTLSIRQIISDKFSSADLDGKIANFSEETSPEELSDSGPFKNLTGDGELLAQKKYGDPYSFRNRAKLIMTYNEIPMLKDLSPGMLSRPIIVPWKKDLTVDGSQDRGLKAKLLQELPGIFNFALEGWRRLEEQGDFTKSIKTTLALNEIQNASCSAFRWIEEQVYFLPCETGKTFDPKALYTVYRAWVEDGGGKPYAEMKFHRRIHEHPEMKKHFRRTKFNKEYFSLRLGAKNLEKDEF